MKKRKKKTHFSKKKIFTTRLVSGRRRRRCGRGSRRRPSWRREAKAWRRSWRRWAWKERAPRRTNPKRSRRERKEKKRSKGMTQLKGFRGNLTIQSDTEICCMTGRNEPFSGHMDREKDEVIWYPSLPWKCAADIYKKTGEVLWKDTSTFCTVCFYWLITKHKASFSQDNCYNTRQAPSLTLRHDSCIHYPRPGSWASRTAMGITKAFINLT